MLVLGIVAGAMFVAFVVGLYVWTRRFERDVEVPTRELTSEEKLQNVVRGAASINIIGGGGGSGF